MIEQILPGLRVLFHLLLAETCFVKVSLQGRTFQYARRYKPFHLQDQDDLCDGAGRNFPFELDCLADQFIEVLRKGLRTALLTVHRL